MAKKADPERITVEYDLHDLPTAQHRAGLAGLILQIDSMGPDGNRRASHLIPEILEITPSKATLIFTKESLQGVFDDLYAAVLVDGKFPARKKKQGVDIPEDYVEEVEFKGKRDKRYVYVNSQTQPLAPAISRHVQAKASSWVELWRRMVWEIPRGGTNVRARAPFDQRAKSPDQPCGEGTKAWAALVKLDASRAKSQSVREPISGALLLGAQAINAESVPFEGRVDHNLLLHFWQVVVTTFTPQVIAKKDGKTKRVGYVLTIPDVADLVTFRIAFPRLLGNLKADPQGFPEGSRIDVPEQANLQVLTSLKGDPATASAQLNDAKRAIHRGPAGTAKLAKAASPALALESLGTCVRAVESFHMFKLGNNIKMLAFNRVAERPGLIAAYRQIAKELRNPLFRGARLSALAHDEPWNSRFAALFAEYPHPFFLEIEGKTPKFLPRFGRDARAQFAAHYQEVYDVTLDEMDDDEKLKHLGVLVRRLMKGYVDRKAAKKLGVDWDRLPTEGEGREQRKVLPDPEKFRDAQRRVCDDAFLQLRSRHDEDLVEFIANSILAVPHYFDSKAGDLAFFTQVLMTPPNRNPVARPARNRDDIKTLAMLALSAYSFNVRKRDAKKEGSAS